ncbi:MAG: divalent-cation tolerance protein CutA [Magnetococcales bacterium]|nr:divalent-cation tolerance protein CutA [Magnetococcales bacterium]
MKAEIILVWTTLPGQQAAVQLARQLLEEQYVACAHLLPGGRSLYRWQGAIQDEEEWTLLLKTRQTLYARLEQRIQQLHPYEVPEILATPVVAVLPAYAAWLQEVVPEQPLSGSD